MSQTLDDLLLSYWQAAQDHSADLGKTFMTTGYPIYKEIYAHVQHLVRHERNGCATHVIYFAAKTDRSGVPVYGSRILELAQEIYRREWLPEVQTKTPEPSYPWPVSIEDGKVL